MKQRLGIALALLGDPPILICEEPVNGLDPEGVHWIRDALAALLAGHGATVTVDGDHGLAVTGLNAPTIADLAAERAIPVHELTPRHATLEQAYLDLTEATVDYPAGASAGKEAVAP